MKTIEQLGISPTPWKYTSDGMGYNDIKCAGCSESDAEYEGENIIATMVAETDARLIAAAPELYKCLREAVSRYCDFCDCDAKMDCHYGRAKRNERPFCVHGIVKKWRDALAAASGESEAAK